MRDRILAARRAADVASICATIYGEGFADRTGVVQVVAVTETTREEAHVIRIQPGAPRSTVDFFVLNLVRARADVVVISGEILRREPELRYDPRTLFGEAEVGGALEQWRDALGRAPLELVVLTRSGNVPFDHPVWSSVPKASIHTTEASAARIAESARTRGIEVWGSVAPGVSASIEQLRRQGHTTISIEAGPSASAPLYASGGELDELVRSVYDGPIEPAVTGPATASSEELHRSFRRRGVPFRTEEEPQWRFEWWTRRAASG